MRAAAPANSATPLARYGARLLLLLALAALAGTAASRLLKFGPDFEYFHKAGAALLERGTRDPGYDTFAGVPVYRDALNWYWPAVGRLMTLFAWLPPLPAGLLWLALNLGATVATLYLLATRITGPPGPDWALIAVVPFLWIAPFWYWEYRLSQINNFTLLLLVGAYVCWQRRHHAAAGLWLGLAVILKLTPGLLIVWFALKRQWAVVAAALITIALAGPLADVAVLGPRETADAYRGWLARAVQDGSPRALIERQVEMDWRNSALGATLCRWLHPTSYALRFDNDPRFRERDPDALLNVAALPTATVARIASAAAILLLAALCLWAWRGPADPAALRTRVEWAIFMLAMLWLMPVMRRYHMIWCLPAVFLLAEALRAAAPGWRRGCLWAAALALLAAQVAMFSNRLEAMGALLLGTAPMALALILLTRRPAAPAPQAAP